MTVPRKRLAIDFGTSNTVAVLEGRPLLFDGVPVLPSAVCADRSGGLLVGRDATHAAATTPEGYEPYPKRRVDDGVVLLGHTEVPVTHLVAAVLARVAGEARTVGGGAEFDVTLTYPVAWATPRQDVLRAAARLAGLGEVRLVPEPVAAAGYFAANAGVDLPVGSYAVVYDIGAGTFDVSVVRRDASGFEVVTAGGLDDGGGLDLDAAVVAHLGATYAVRDPARWNHLTAPATPADQRAARTLWDQVRTGREMLSRASTTYIHLPLLEHDAPLGREQFDVIAAPVLERTVATTVAVLRRSDITPADLGGVFLVGGASRSPLVATLLHRALGVAPRVIDQPELAVALGCQVGTAPAPATATVGLESPQRTPASTPPPPRRRGRRGRIVAVAASVVVLLAVAGALLVPQLLDRDRRNSPNAAPSPTGSASAPAGAPPTTPPSASSSVSTEAPTDDADRRPGDQWADTLQFMEIGSGEIRGGQVFLKVRIATKEPQGESFDTIPGTGPFIEVEASADARVLRLRNDRRGESSTMEELLADLRGRSREDAEEGFNVSFNPLGHVKQVEWLFIP